MLIKTLRLVAALAGAFLLVDHARAATHRIEPDDYAEGAVLNDVHPLVELRIFDGFIVDDFPNDFGEFPDPDIIPVTANENDDIFGGYFTSTGTKSFGHANIAFFPESRQLAMRFLAPTTQVSVDFIGTNSLSDAVGVLEIFNSQGILLDTFTSVPVTAHEVATLSLTRPAGDIGYARAFSSPEDDPFGTLDNLQFNTLQSGDFNGDGAVDAADYIVWRKGLGTTYLPSHYGIWREHFGRTAGMAATSPANFEAAVPEPASTLRLAMSSVMLLCMSPTRVARSM